MSSRADKVKVKDSETRVWLIFFLGIIMTGFGITYAAATAPKASQASSLFNEIVSGVFTAVGGGIVGATISLLVTGSSDRDALKKMRSVIEESLQNTLVSDEASLVPVRRLWHHYYVTRVEEKPVWKYELLDFTLSLAVRSAVVAVAVESDSGLKHMYRMEAGVRGNQLIMLANVIGGDRTAVTEVFPQFLDFKTRHFGIGLFEDWDGFSILTKAVLSTSPLISIGEGTVPEEHIAYLDEAWQRGFTGHNTIFPSGS